MDKGSKTKTDIKDWFIVQRIRILNFIKEHKYISVAIFTFLFAALIGFIVYADDTVDTKASIEQISIEGASDSKVKSFSSLTYNVEYQLLLDDKENNDENNTTESSTTIENNIEVTKDVVIEGILDGTIDAEWQLYYNDDIQMNVVKDENFNKVFIEVYSIKLNELHDINLILNVKNVENGTEIIPKFKVYDKKYKSNEIINSEDEKENPSAVMIADSIFVESEEIELSTKIIGGTAYKVQNFNGRYAPFGIVLGFEKNDLENMKGLYFNREQSIYLSAIQSYEDEKLEELNAEFALEEGYFGVYNSNINNNHLDDSIMSNVYDSGKVQSLKILEDLDEQIQEGLEENIEEGSEETENPEEPENLDNTYELKISDIGSELKFYVNEIDDVDFVTLGTYFVTIKSPREEENEGEIYVELLDNSSLEYGMVINNYVETGDVILSYDIGNIKNQEFQIADKDSFTFGEEAILRTKFSYISADEAIDNVNIKINLKSDSVYPLSLINYYEESSEQQFYITDGYNVSDDVTYKVLNEEEKSASFSEILELSSRGINIEYLIFNIQNIEPESEFELRIKTKINYDDNIDLSEQIGTKNFICSYELSEIGEEDVEASIHITPFKARINIFSGNGEEDTTIEGSNNKNEFIIIPEINMPALKTNKSILQDSGDVVDLTITVKLPEGINYVENKDYLAPSKINGNELIYYLNDKTINYIIDSFSLSVNYDINLETNKDLIVTALVQATTKDNIYSDISDESVRTATRTVTYINNDEIVGRLYTDKITISENEEFSITARLYNSTVNAIPKSVSADLIMILPYNENMSNNNNYTGKYSYKIDSETYMCTNEVPSSVKNLTDEQWVNCSTIDKESVTAVKFSVDSLEPGEVFEQNITIIPEDNNQDDKYTISSYLKLNSENTSNKYKTLKPISVSVFSKQIKGVVWEDFDDNGIFDSEEDYVQDVTLKLFDASTNEEIDTTTSNSKGEYVFSGVEEGTYYIVANFRKDKYYATKNVEYKDMSKVSIFYQDNLSEEKDLVYGTARTNSFTINDDVKTKSNCNLGLSIQKTYKVELKKYITKIELTNDLGKTETKEYNKETLVKLDVKDINKLKIKVTYLIEVENVGFYPGYVYNIKDYIPNGMTFNQDYKENTNWTQVEDYVVNKSLSNVLLEPGEKVPLWIAFDVSRKEAGSFINYVRIEDEDLEIFNKNNILKGGN